MMHPDTRATWVSDALGYGVIATAPLRAGTILWASDPLETHFEAAELAALPPLLRAQVERLAYLDPHGRHALSWDHGRFINHSCTPTLCFGGYACTVAARDLVPGDALTEDYAGTMAARFDCLCGAPGCRGFVHPERDPTLIATWQRRFEEVLPRIPHVPQPLWELLDPEDRRSLLAAARGEEPCRPVTGMLAEGAVGWQGEDPGRAARWRRVSTLIAP